MMNKCVLVIGRESTGSKLIAKIIAHILGVADYGSWEGHDWASENRDGNIVLHQSLPNDKDWIDVDKFIDDNPGYEYFVVLTTRDKTLAKQSRIETYNNEHVEMDGEGLIAKDIMLSIINSDKNYYVWSYESFMFLGLDYLNPIFKFLGIEKQ